MTGPSIQFVPFWNWPWACKAVGSFKELWTFITKTSPRVTSTAGILKIQFSQAFGKYVFFFFEVANETYGHLPLIPTTWRAFKLSGLILSTYVMFISYTTLAAWIILLREINPVNKMTARICFWSLEKKKEKRKKKRKMKRFSLFKMMWGQGKKKIIQSSPCSYF